MDLRFCKRHSENQWSGDMRYHGTEYHEHGAMGIINAKNLYLLRSNIKIQVCSNRAQWIFVQMTWKLGKSWKVWWFCLRISEISCLLLLNCGFFMVSGNFATISRLWSYLACTFFAAPLAFDICPPMSINGYSWYWKKSFFVFYCDLH